jgi:O-antigen/teichoic acid export membrane protein
MAGWSQAIRWQTLSVGVQIVLQLLFTAVLARLLSPADFGIMAIALVVVGVVEIFAQIGIGPALVQRKELSDADVVTAFWTSAALGVGSFGILWTAAPAVGALYAARTSGDTELLVDVLRVIALSFVISGFTLVPRSLLIRRMAFDRLFRSSLLAMGIGNLGIGLGLAWVGAGVWSYVAALLAQNALMGVFNTFQAPYPVRGWPSAASLRSMLGYGARSTLFNLANYAATKVDTLVVSLSSSLSLSLSLSLRGWEATGVYDRAAYLYSLPITVLGKLSDNVLFSGMSALQDRQLELQRTVQRGIQVLGLVVLPATVFLSAFASDVAVVLLGPRFAASGPIAAILFAGLACRALTKLGDATVRATDLLAPAVALKFVFVGLIAGGAWVALRSGAGLTGVAWALTAATVVQCAGMAVLVRKAVGAGAYASGRPLLPGLALAGAAGAAAAATHALPITASWIQLACGTALTLAFCFLLVLSAPHLLDGADPALRRSLASRLPLPGSLRARMER